MAKVTEDGAFTVSWNTFRPVWLVDGVRTPFLKVWRQPNSFSASDLAVAAMRALLARQPFAPGDLDEVILGCVVPAFEEVNIARVAALKAGVPKRVPALTVNRVCGSGMQSIDLAARNIMLGEAELVLAGGTESMSHMPHKAMACALADTVVDMRMGDTAEVLARKFRILREEMDAFALASHRRAAAAWEAGRFDTEVAPVTDAQGNMFDRDTGIRPDTSLEKLAALKPAFDEAGMVTAGNSSQITDGACVVLLASDAAVEKYGLTPLARVADAAWAGLEPREMGLGPAYAMAKLLLRQGFGLDAVDAFEINEAFAVQVLAVLRALADEKFCREELGLASAAGTIPHEKLNVDGGAIALGHPLAASGARIVLHLAHVLRRSGGKRGIASLCIGGGQGGAMLLERP